MAPGMPFALPVRQFRRRMPPSSFSPFDAHRVGHDDDGAVALRQLRHINRAGVPAGGFYNYGVFFKSPFCSASSTIAFATLSPTLPAGLKHSILPYMDAKIPLLFHREHTALTGGVLPINSVMVRYTFIIETSVSFYEKV